MIFTTNAIDNRKKRLAQAWNDLLSPGDCVLVYAGDPINKPGGLDQNYDFLPHPSYFWLTGYRLPAGVAAYSKDLGWTVFVRPLSQAELVWEGPAEFEEHGTQISEFNNYLGKHQFKRIYSLGQKPQSVVDRGGSAEELFVLKTRMDQVRRVKDEEEIALVKKVADIANFGYQKMKAVLRPGITEREFQIEYESEICKHGAHGTPYGTLVGSGANSAILHSVPTHKKIQNGDWVLVDAGAHLYDYCVDITRMFAVSGEFSSQQKMIVELVKKAQAEALDKARAGIQWRSVHEASARVIAEGLRGLNIISGSVDDAIESGAISVFYPHGVGHLVGLRVRDTGHEENINPRKHCGVTLRVDFELKENYMLTVEPGCYFIKPLVMDSSLRTKYKDLIHWSEAEKWLNIGGVRIEDDIVIKKSAPDILTSLVEK